MAHIKKIVSEKTGKVSYRVFIKTPIKTITKTFKKKSEASQFAKSIEGNADIQNLVTHPVLNQTYSDAVNGFKSLGKDPQIYSRLNYFESYLGHMKLNLIKSNHIKDVLNTILQDGKTGTTFNRYLGDFGTFCKWVTVESGTVYKPHVIIKAQSFRTQEKNREDALNRLVAIIKKAKKTQKKRRPTKPTKASKKRRLDNKTKAGQQKALRRKVDF